MAAIAAGALVIAILLVGGVQLMSGTPITVQGDNGQLVNNPFPGGVPGFVLVTGLLAVPVLWVLFVAR